VLRYRSLGHTGAWLDPTTATRRPAPTALSLEALAFSEADMDADVATHFYRKGQRMKLARHARRRCAASTATALASSSCTSTRLRCAAGCRSASRSAHQTSPRPAREEQVQALKWLLEPETFERFLHERFVGQKRFSIEGARCHDGRPANRCWKSCLRAAVEEIVMGMAHRGRLSVLANFLKKPLAMLFNEFQRELRAQHGRLATGM